MPLPPGPGGCCTLERAPPEVHLQAPGRLPQPRRFSSDPPPVIPAGEATGMSLSPLSTRSSPHWMDEWEERQRRQLKQHEEATRQLVEVMRGELLEKLERMEQSQSQVRGRKVNASPKVWSSGEEKGRLQESPILLVQKDPAGEGRMKNDGTSSMPAVMTMSSGADKRAPSSSFTEMNAAMLSAIGASKCHGPGTTTSILSSGSDCLDSLRKAQVFKPTNRHQARLFSLVHSHFFEMMSGAVILIYTVVVGILSDLDMRAAIDKQESPDWRYYVDLSFTAIFLIELVLRVAAEGPYYLSNKNRERAWNMFDFFATTVGLLDVFTVFQVNLSFVRVLRTLRAIRVLRVIRIFRFFKELRLMVASILCCLRSLTWAFLLLTAVMYIFAVVLLQGASDYLHSYNLGEVPEDLALNLQLFDDFGGILKTIYSLTQAVSGGRSWGEYAAPFIKISPWYGIFFTMLVVFVILGVLNILTGIFVESTSAVASFDKELVIQEEMSRNESVVNQIRALFREIDRDNSGTLTFKELKSNLSDERVKAYFAVLQLDVTEAAGLFELLDRDESGDVSIEEFIMTCMQLKGTARSVDVATMLFQSKRLYSTITKFMATIDKGLKDIEARLASDPVDELG